MKNTGITGKIDDMGRIVLPIELRRNLGIAEGTELEISIDGGNIVLSPVASIPLTPDELERRCGKPVFIVTRGETCGDWKIVSRTVRDGQRILVVTENEWYCDSAEVDFYDHEV